MVGIILVKDFVTGSYSYAKIAVFDGNSYSDIDYGKPFSQYVIDTVNKKIVSKTVSKKVDVGYFELMNLCDGYMNFLVSNPDAVCFEFKQNDDRTEFRILPTNHGNFVLPDLYNFFYGNAVYFPVKTYTFKMGNGALRSNPLEADVCCELINYALHTLLNNQSSLFYQAGGTLYIDIVPAIKNITLRSSLRRYLSAYSEAYENALRIYKNRTKEISYDISPLPHNAKSVRLAFEEACENTDGEYYNLVCEIRKAKIRTLNIASDKLSKVGKDEFIRNLFEFAKNPEFNEIKNDLYNKLLNYAEKLVAYKHLPDINHIKYLRVNDILTAQFSAKHRSEIFIKAKLSKYMVTNFEDRDNYLVSWDGTAYRI